MLPSLQAFTKALTTAKLCAQWDSNADTRAVTESMIAAAEAGAGGDVEAQNELVAAFGSRLNFGTAGIMCCEDTRRVAHCLTMCVRSPPGAGIRGKMGAGTARMNDLTVTQTAQVCCHCQSLANPSQLLNHTHSLLYLLHRVWLLTFVTSSLMLTQALWLLLLATTTALATLSSVSS